ncbi:MULTISPECIES: hypothetical protein [Paenibacillus]|uniref:Uncharacterized protein n=1 Tax=Paenibacillus violae TaxID=3077234 RepID=A0ABU3RCZ9_9BACL|nr:MULTISPECIES: hypothetical protein [Paenibacillus]MDU0201702.1 hypothetical protein [Paenibacillus sp. PFR10]MEC0268911.1 hypothetical protein [Paenibacillus anseongense]
MYEETCRIPLFVKSAGNSVHREENHFVGPCDLYATILEQAGVEREKARRTGMDGALKIFKRMRDLP